MSMSFFGNGSSRDDINTPQPVMYSHHELRSYCTGCVVRNPLLILPRLVLNIWHLNTYFSLNISVTGKIFSFNNSMRTTELTFVPWSTNTRRDFFFMVVSKIPRFLAIYSSWALYFTTLSLRWYWPIVLPDGSFTPVNWLAVDWNCLPVVFYDIIHGFWMNTNPWCHVIGGIFWFLQS